MVNRNGTGIAMKAGAIAVAVLLSACGGGGGDGDGTPTVNEAASIQGTYGGNLTGSSSPQFQMLMLENGEFWALYGTKSGSSFYLAGFTQGSGIASNGSFTSSNAKDFGFYPAVGGTISATYNAAAHTISGTVRSSGGTSTFSGATIPDSTYNYDAAASISSVAGSWTLTTLAGDAMSLSVASNGAFTANAAGCSFSGTISPRPSGKNVFNVSLTFGGAPCELPNQSATGIALTYPVAAGSSQNQLLVAVTNSARTAGAAAFGNR